MKRTFNRAQPPKGPVKRSIIIALILGVAVFFTAPVVSHFLGDTDRQKVIQTTQPAFPTFSADNLSPQQAKIATLLKAEYEKQPKSFDTTVLKYTDNIEESWCADFISWIFLQTNNPLSNPNSGYWRIPGVLTLQQYYRTQGRYIAADNAYTPTLGDVVFYIGAQTPDNTSDEHAAIVIKIEGDVLTTIGGNEANGIMRIRAESLQQHRAKGMVGYGKLQK